MLVFDLMKTSFQEERSWHEAENRPAHILFGSLHRKWKYVSKAKKQNFTFITFVHMKAFHAKGAHKMVYQDKAKNCIITPHHISTKCVNMLFLNFSQFWNSLESFEINQKYPEYFEKFFSHLEISWQIYVSPCGPESFLTFNLLFIICANTFWTHQNLPNKQKLSP